MTQRADDERLLGPSIDIGSHDEADPAAHDIHAALDRAGRRYRRIPDDVAPTAGLVIVGIGWEPQLRPLANPTADVGWTELLGRDAHWQAGGEGPYPVLEAFARAEAIAARFDAEVVVSIGSVTHWRDAWGALIEDDDV